MLPQIMSKRAALYEYVSMVEPSLIKKFSEQVRGNARLRKLTRLSAVLEWC